MVLATDMSVHFAICKDMKVMLAEDSDPEEYVHNVLAVYCYTVPRSQINISKIFWSWAFAMLIQGPD